MVGAAATSAELRPPSSTTPSSAGRPTWPARRPSRGRTARCPLQTVSPRRRDGPAQRRHARYDLSWSPEPPTHGTTAGDDPARPPSGRDQFDQDSRNPREMSTAPQGAPNADPQVHRELQALKAWRDAAVRSGRIRPNVIADTHLTEIVLRGASTSRRSRTPCTPRSRAWPRRSSRCSEPLRPARPRGSRAGGAGSGATDSRPAGGRPNGSQPTRTGPTGPGGTGTGTSETGRARPDRARPDRGRGPGRAVDQSWTGAAGAPRHRSGAAARSRSGCAPDLDFLRSRTSPSRPGQDDPARPRSWATSHSRRGWRTAARWPVDAIMSQLCIGSWPATTSRRTHLPVRPSTS